MLFLDGNVIIRYICIFKLKNPAAFWDHFWCRFINLWIVAFSLIVEVLNIMLTENQRISNLLHICLGEEPTDYCPWMPVVRGELK